ncbi:HAMP domain-containing sensor histidine kinase [Streptomyces griseorubiginosus]|uniref:sensor histidine kinase n=1 Tax=Streptomyces griseorubiginosus TaxID=67304 RepID=UPI002E800A7C|nr:HAMP domain-containing sensor histidine kinase [Streptomyces griseorubiginosus]WUB42096.1 HAMP domain-containing histidine kinase [Streptomyces griseorubiginosus]WUB50615.1 HAMP domain-containing histidine kinase [Streptomyces griseorubiginosus]
MNRVLRRLTPRTPHTPGTLRGRLSLVALTAAALLMTVLTVVFNIVMERHLRQQADDELLGRAAAIATTVDTTGPHVRVLATGHDGLLDTNTWIYTGNHLLEKPASATPHNPLTAAAGRLAAHEGRTCSTLRGERHRSVRLCSDLVTGGRTTATVVTALDLSPYQSSADSMLVGSLVLDAVTLACTCALTHLVIGRALRPVRTMTDQATRWSAVGSAQRFGTAGHPAELARLGTSLDALLDRIRAVLRHEQQLTAELSHELRTPLTRIVAELDWWRARPRSAAETHATHAVIAEAARSMRTICDTLLDEARDSTRAPATAPGTADVGPLLRRLAELQDAARGVKIRVETPDAELTAGVTDTVLERIVSPLLANALRHADATVTVRARPAPGAIRFDVEDDGPGVPDTFTADLFQPGRRADPDDGHDGAGLGLSLARRLARQAGGEVVHDAGHTPGARFTVTLPIG